METKDLVVKALGMTDGIVVRGKRRHTLTIRLFSSDRKASKHVFTMNTSWRRAKKQFALLREGCRCIPLFLRSEDGEMRRYPPHDSYARISFSGRDECCIADF